MMTETAQQSSRRLADEIGQNVHRVLERDHRVSAVILGHERAERARRKHRATIEPAQSS
jgi:hypothetical protein